MNSKGQEPIQYATIGLVIVAIIVSGVSIAVSSGYKGPSADKIASAVSKKIKISKPTGKKPTGKKPTGKKYIPGTSPFKVGDLDPLTGPSAPVGKGQQRGVKLADRDIEKAGGIYGHRLDVLYRDSGSMPTPGVDAAKKLVEVSGVPAFVGSFSSGVNKAIIESVTDPSEVVHVGQGCTSPKLPVVDEKGYFFRACMNDLYQGAALGKRIYESGARKLAIMYANNPYGKGLQKATKIRFEKLGGKVVKSVKHDLGKTSYSSQIDALMGANPDATLFITYPEDAITQFKYVFKRGYTKTDMWGCDAWRSPDIPKSVGWDKMDGIKGTAGGVPYGKSGEIFRKEFKKAYGHPPEVPFVPTGYDALFTIALSIAKAGKRPANLSGSDIKAQMVDVSSPPGTKIHPGPEGFKKGLKLIRQGKEINYVGAAGPVEYDPKSHDAASSVEIWKISSEKEALTTADVIVPKPVPRKAMGKGYVLE